MMTCVVGLETPEGVIMGADSCVCHGPLDENINLCTKMYRLKGPNADWLIGTAGHTRIGQLVHFKFKPPIIKAFGDTSLTRLMVTEVSDMLRQIFKEGEKLTKKDEESTFDANIMIGVMGRVFQISSDCAVIRESCGFKAVGSGADYAMGAMHATAEMDPRQRVKAALGAAERFCSGVRRPFKILKASR
jgi:ATP-dependent protease HslVU (ClpYQ) peptidase subunit